MFLNNALYRCQPNPCTFEVLRPVQALKNPKEFVGVFHTESHPVIPHVDHRDAFFLFLSDLNYRLLPRPCEFQRVRQ